MRKVTALFVLLQFTFVLSSSAMAPKPPKPDVLWDNYTVGDKMSTEQEEAFFKTYIAIGDSLSQGCQGLNVEENRQYYSFPAQLARQMNTEFNQPLIKFPGVGIPNPEDWIKKREITALTIPQTLLGFRRVDSYRNQGSINNFGVTAATLDQVLDYDAYLIFDDFRPFTGSYTEGTPIINDLLGTVSPFFIATLGAERFIKSPVDQALDRNPTFLTVWIGNNDTVIASMMGDPELCTGLDFWEMQWQELIDRIKSTDSIKGVTIINLVDSTEAPVLQPINNEYHEISEDSDIPDGSLVPFFITSSNKLNQVMTPVERKKIQDRVKDFNNIIKTTCDEENWLMIDSYSAIKQGLDSGWRLLYADGSESDIVLTGEYAYGGLFSLDGMHPTSAAYAHMTNIAVKEINEFYGTSLPLVNEVEVWENDTLCQDPVDPREHKEILKSVSYLFNTFLLPIMD